MKLFQKPTTVLGRVMLGGALVIALLPGLAGAMTFQDALQEGQDIPVKAGALAAKYKQLNSKHHESCGDFEQSKATLETLKQESGALQESVQALRGFYETSKEPGVGSAKGWALSFIDDTIEPLVDGFDNLENGVSGTLKDKKKQFEKEHKTTCPK